jgi:hypothetical protein
MDGTQFLEKAFMITYEGLVLGKVLQKRQSINY